MLASGTMKGVGNVSRWGGTKRMPEVEWSAEVAQAGWVRQRLSSFNSGQVTSVVPAGFAAYARVLHPAHDSAGRVVRWAEVAARSDLALNADSHFSDIALQPPTGATTQPRIFGPEEGTLTPADAAALVDILRRHTTSTDHCWFCLWDGYGWDSAATLTTALPARGSEPPPRAVPGRAHEESSRLDHVPAPPSEPPDPVPNPVRTGPRVELPHRTYFLYRGPIEQALAFVESERQTPNLWWPEDRAWCVATEIDLDYTYIGGAPALIDDIVESDRIEALPADPAQRHHMRLPAWLTAAIDDATARLLCGHHARVETSQGAVTARLRRPRRLRHGDLWIASTRPDGTSDGSSWTSLSGRRDEALGEEVRHELSWAVIDLLR